MVDNFASKKMTRSEAAEIIKLRIETDRRDVLGGKGPESDFDRFIAEQDEALEMALEMLTNPVEHLTQRELVRAYRTMEHKWDVADIENELQLSEEEYIEKYGIDKKPVTDIEKEDMADRLRRMLDKDADAQWSYCCHEAVSEVLSGRRLYEV